MTKKTYYKIQSPKNARIKAERAAPSRLSRRKCWFCGRWFTPTDKFTRYCGQRCRHWHLHETEDAWAYRQETRHSISGFGWCQWNRG